MRRAFSCKYRLGGKVLEERDLSLGEGTNLLPIHGDCAAKRCVLAQSNSDAAADAARVNQCPEPHRGAISFGARRIIDHDDALSRYEPLQRSTGGGHWLPLLPGDRDFNRTAL
jgi:hypothetical protein